MTLELPHLDNPGYAGKTSELSRLLFGCFHEDRVEGSRPKRFERARPLGIRARGVTAVVSQAPEPVQVDQVRVDVEHVPGVPALESHAGVVAEVGRLLEQLPDPAQVRVKDVARPGRRLIAPDPVNERLDGHRPPWIQRQRRQHGLLPGRADVQQPAHGQHLDLPEQPELHRPPSMISL